MIFALLIVFFNLGFSQEPPPEQNNNAVQEPPKTPEQEINLENEYSIIKKNLEPFIYNSFDLRDPFKKHQTHAPLVPGGLYGPFLPLQYFQLGDIKLKGILWRVKDPKILVEDPGGKLHRLGVKDYLGENFGYVAVIREKEVVVVQTIMREKTSITETKLLTLNQ